MSGVAVVTDSTSDLSAQDAAEAGITIVPLQVIFGDEAYIDGVTLTADAFYEKLATATVFPSTSQPSVGEFAQTFERLLDTHEAVVAILLSGKLSGTVQAARSAAEAFGDKVRVIDSRTTAYALGFMALEAASAAAAGAGVDAIAARVEEVDRYIQPFFVVHSLEHLRRGGRIGNAAALIGSLLQLRPIITIQDGIVDTWAKVRTEQRALQTLLDRVSSDGVAAGSVQVAVIHTSAHTEAQAFADAVRNRVSTAVLRVRQIGPVIGTHLGAGSIGMVTFACRNDAG
jgi:DegV family protein with EDD domain